MKLRILWLAINDKNPFSPGNDTAFRCGIALSERRPARTAVTPRDALIKS